MANEQEEKPKCFTGEMHLYKCTTCGKVVWASTDAIECEECGCTYFVQEAS